MYTNELNLRLFYCLVNIKLHFKMELISRSQTARYWHVSGIHNNVEWRNLPCQSVATSGSVLVHCCHYYGYVLHLIICNASNGSILARFWHSQQCWVEKLAMPFCCRKRVGTGPFLSLLLLCFTCYNL